MEILGEGEVKMITFKNLSYSLRFMEILGEGEIKMIMFKDREFLEIKVNETV